MTGAFNPADDTHATQNRPDHVNSGADIEKWFRACTTPGASDHTRLRPQDLNFLLAQYRYAMSQLNVSDDEGDDSILYRLLQAAGPDIWITADTTLTVGATGDFASIQAALDSVNLKLIAPGITVTISLESGTYPITEPIRIAPRNADGIIIKGVATPDPLLDMTDFTDKGLAADAETMLRATYGAVIEASDCDGFHVLGGAKLKGLENIAVLGSAGAVGSLSKLEFGHVGLRIDQTSHATVTKCAFHGFGGNVFVVGGSALDATRLILSHGGTANLVVSGSSTAMITLLLAAYSGKYGVFAGNGAHIDANGAYSYYSDYANFYADDQAAMEVVNSFAAGSGNYNILSLDGGFIQANNTWLGTAPGTSLYASRAAFIWAANATGDLAASPAFGIDGNSNAMIKD